MARADGVLCQDQRAIRRIPDGKSPISEELRKAVSSPPFVSARDDGNIGRSNVQGISQITDELGTVVQAAVPGEDRTRRRNVRLRLASRFLRRMKGTEQDSD